MLIDQLTSVITKM